jgi:DNA gyrase subunit A
VSSLAKLPEEELTASEPLEQAAAALDSGAGTPHAPHILDDGVAQAEASDHLDVENGKPGGES